MSRSPRCRPGPSSTRTPPNGIRSRRACGRTRARIALMRPVTAATRSADLLREGRGLPARARRPRGRPRCRGRVDRTGRHVTARTDRVDVDALLIRPDGCVARALPTGQDLDATTLVRALGTWFGQPA
ncbi:hypothetical protein [Streptomyces sp. enrichment culture]|uniref:aromatic-ring hydroxylase C-terminal domain-containing protein n=1 Tax=Streptomyces sp. enrichment culture TaxID=1795815 RepID=UPI003F55EF5C